MIVNQKANKIVILTSAHRALDDRIFHKQAKSLAKAGYNVTLIAQHDKNETVDSVKIILLPKPRNRFQRMFGLTLKILLISLKEKADIYHFHDPELIPIGIIIKLLIHAKVIYDVHEDYPASIKTTEWLPSFLRNIVAIIFDVFEKICCNFFDVVVPATEDISKRFQNKIIIIHNYPILSYTTNIASLGKSNGLYTIIYFGGLTKPRGISEIVQSLEYIDEKLKVKLKLLGEFSDPDFEKEITSMEVFSKVDWGYVPYKEINYNLSVSHIGLVLFHPVPNHIRSMPSKIFEYMAAGLPVIASNFPLWKEIIERNNCGLTVNPMNPQEIAHAVEYLLERPELMEEMGKNGRKVALGKYNWEQEAKKLLKLYADVLGRKVTRNYDIGKM